MLKEANIAIGFPHNPLPRQSHLQIVNQTDLPVLVDEYVLCMSVTLRCQQVVHGGPDHTGLVQLGLKSNQSNIMLSIHFIDRKYDE